MAYYTQEQIEKAREMDRADRKPTLEKKKMRAVYRTYSMQTCPLCMYIVLESTWCSQ